MFSIGSPAFEGVENFEVVGDDARHSVSFLLEATAGAAFSYILLTTGPGKW